MDGVLPVIVIVGPTASGKTALSLGLAEALNGEILSADSRQLYRYMDIGTATPTAEELARAVHHGINIKNPDEFYSAGAFLHDGRAVLDDMLRRGHQPIVVGGSGLYVQALTEGFFGGHYRDEMLREHLRAETRRRGIEAMRRWLAELDEAALSKIMWNDEKRLLRALEVCLLSGEPISRLQEDKTEASEHDFVYLGLDWPREELYTRINRRVDAMMADGLLEEVKDLLHRGYSLEHNALDSVGYKEIILALEGQHTLDEAVELIKRNTRRFSKRQMTWFRRNPEVRWLPVDETTTADELTGRALNVIKSN